MTSTGTPRKPVPVADELSEGYWRAVAEGRLAIQRCEHCSRYSHPPSTICIGCLGTTPSFTFAEVSGRGRIVTWTMFRQTFLPGFRDDVPYVVALVELAEQPALTMLGRLVDGAEAALSIGAEVDVVFEEIEPGAFVPAFALSGSGS